MTGVSSMTAIASGTLHGIVVIDVEALPPARGSETPPFRETEEPVNVA